MDLNLYNSILLNSLNQSNLIFIITNWRGEIEYVSDSFVTVTGYSKSEIIGKKPSILKSGRLKRSYYKELWETILLGKTWKGEFYNRKKNGDYYWESATIIPIKDETGFIAQYVAIKEDITSKKELEEKRQNAELRWKAILENAESIICIHNKEGNIISVSKSVQKILGFLSEELLGKSLIDFAHPEDRSKIGANVELWDHPIGSTIRYRIKKSNGNYIWLNTEIKKIPPEYNPLENNFFSISHDITDLIRRDEEIDEINDMLVSLIANAPDLILVTDLKGNIEYANKFDLSASIGFYKYKSIFDVFPSEQISLLNTFAKQILSSGQVYTFESQLWGNSHNPMFFLVRIGPVYKSDKVDRFILFLTDISEKKAMEKALEESEQRYELAIQGTKDGIWDWELLKGEYYFSPQWKGMLGFREDELKNELYTFESLLHPEERESVLEAIHSTINDNLNELQLEYRLKNKQGNYLWISSHGLVSRSAEGAAFRITGVNKNITEKKNAEHEIQKQLNKLLDLNDTKNKFLSIISHDLRGPIGAFTSLTEFLLGQLDKISMEDMKSHIGVLDNTAKNIYNMLEDLLLWARTQYQEAPKEIFPFNTSSAIKKAIQYVEKIAESKDITVHFKEDHNLFCIGDSEAITIVIRNLLSNAIKFSFKNGQIKIRQRVLKYKEEEFVEIIVQDFGMGMSPDIIQKLFRLDIKYTSRGTNGEKGHGLGLKLCKELIEKNMGTIEVESTPGQGSIFKVNLKRFNEIMVPSL